jgi:hypothetical protein
MATMRLVPLELARSGPLEAFGCATIGFHFRHNNVPQYLLNSKLIQSDPGVSKRGEVLLSTLVTSKNHIFAP